jgi:hypothetical protein
MLADEVLSATSTVNLDEGRLILNILNSTRELSNRRMAFSEKDGNLYEIKAIVDSCREESRFEYLVHWKGYSDTTHSWEPLDNVVGAWESVAEFEKRWPEKEKPGMSEIEREKEKEVWKEIEKMEIKKVDIKGAEVERTRTAQTQEIERVQEGVEAMLGEVNTEEDPHRFKTGPDTAWPWRDPALMRGGKL